MFCRIEKVHKNSWKTTTCPPTDNACASVHFHFSKTRITMLALRLFRLLKHSFVRISLFPPSRQLHPISRSLTPPIQLHSHCIHIPRSITSSSHVSPAKRVPQRELCSMQVRDQIIAKNISTTGASHMDSENILQCIL